jgi:geranylgeranyl pyrophosphate synthase
MVSNDLATTTFFTPVQDYLPLLETRMRAEASGNHPDLSAALDHLLSSGGKRIRPMIALLTGEMLGAESDRLVTLAAAIELLHTATLVHDDLIDGALLRRGIPTLNAKWSPAATILTGDFIFARAAKLAAETDSVEVMHLFSETLSIIVNGEITQLLDNHAPVNRQIYFQRIHAKTASMFELATTAASILSRVDDEIVESLNTFGYKIGMAFQIVDDVLDFTGEQAMVGKPVASDLRHGIITLPTIKYIEAMPDDPDLTPILSGNFIDEAGLIQLVDSIRESGAVDEAMDEAHQFIASGLDALTSLPNSLERQALEDLAEYIVNRHL